MKVVRMQGGVGNQLFCMAFAHSVAQVAGERVGLDLGSFGNDPYGRRFELEPLAQVFDCFEILHRPRPLLPRKLGKLLRLTHWTFEGAPPADVRELKAFIRKGQRFEGYWQNEAFILEKSLVKEKIRDFLQARAAQFQAVEALLHYRTYKEEEVAALARTPGRDYVCAALRAAATQGLIVRELSLISDDPGLALRRIGDCGLPVRVLRQEAYDDMATMMNARLLILTNSSFSWWGGYCSGAGLVTYPARKKLGHYPRPAASFRVL